MLDKLLAQDEGKTLEFKANARSLTRVVKTIVAFANTAGGTIVIGIQDSTKDIVGVNDPLQDEERLASACAESIRPQLLPDIQVCSWRERQLLVITVPHMVAPYYVASEGLERGVYVRLGSTNRRAEPEMVRQIQLLASHSSFDEQPWMGANSEAIDFRVASELFTQVSRKLTPAKRRTLGLVTQCGNQIVPSLGAVLLFGSERKFEFPDAVVRCARFAGVDTARFMDQLEIDDHLPLVIDKVLSFVQRHTLQPFAIKGARRRELSEYPEAAVREAVINAVVHADYSLTGMAIKIAVFDDRIEVTNPGLLPFGLTMEAALSGVSRLRNKVIGRVFRELGLIEQWGSGIGRILSTCSQAGLKEPMFAEIGASFRVTLFNERIVTRAVAGWILKLIDYLEMHNEISTHQAAHLWETSDRTARTRLRKLVNSGRLTEIGTGPRDPHRKYVLKS